MTRHAEPHEPSDLRVQRACRHAQILRWIVGIVPRIPRTRSVKRPGVRVFNRRRDQVKALWWDLSGFAIWYKRLEAGCFHLGAHQGVISQAELAMILEGIEIKNARRYKRFRVREIGD